MHASWLLYGLWALALGAFAQERWVPSSVNSSVPDALADSELVFGQPNNYVEVLVFFPGGFFDYQICKFVEEYINEQLAPNLRLVVQTRNISMTLTGSEYQEMIMPYFQVDNHIGAVVTTTDVTPTVSMWRIIQACQRLLMTDCTDQQLAQQTSVMSYTPGSQWELLVAFLRANNYANYALLMDDNSRSQQWGTDWLSFSVKHGLECKDASVILTNTADMETLEEGLVSRLDSVASTGARIFISFLSHSTLTTVLNYTQKYKPEFLSPEYMWISGYSMVTLTPYEPEDAKKLGVTVFGGAVEPVKYKDFPEGIALRQAWNEHLQKALAMEGAPPFSDSKSTEEQLSYRAWDLYEKCRSFANGLGVFLDSTHSNATNGTVRRDGPAPTMTFRDYLPAIIAAMIAKPWVSQNGKTILSFDKKGVRQSIPRTITASMSDGRYLGDVARLIDSVFSIDMSDVVYSANSTQKPSRDTYCSGLFIYDPDGSGCLPCPESMCPFIGVPAAYHLTCVPCELAFFDQAIITYMYIVAGISMSLLLIMTICLIVFWRNPVIKKANNVYLLIMMCGGIMTAASTFFQQAYRDGLTCATHRWVAFIGESIMFAAITAKTYRLFRIFRNPSLHRSRPNVLTEVIIITSTVGVMLILYIVFLVEGSSAGGVGRREVFNGGDGFFVYVCAYTNAQYIITDVAWVYCLLLPLVTVSLGFMLKILLDTHSNAKYKDFDELRYIMTGAVFYTSLVLVLLPAEMFVGKNTSPAIREALSLAFYLLFSLGAIILCGGILMPKFYHIALEYREKAENASQQRPQNGAGSPPLEDIGEGKGGSNAPSTELSEKSGGGKELLEPFAQTAKPILDLNG